MVMIETVETKTCFEALDCWSADTIWSGVIVYFNGSNGKHFGFILPDEQEDTVFFHNTRQKKYVCDGGPEPKLKDWWTDEAVKGERVCFVEEKSPKGLRAKWWVKESTYIEALEDCSRLKTYRLRQRIGMKSLSRLQPKPEVRTLWEGKDLSELRLRYSKSVYILSDGETMGMFFQVLEDGKWVISDDPR
jgi:hypothetical protein